LRLYESAPSGAQHRILEHAIEEIGGVPDVMAFVRGYARAGKHFDGSMHQALHRTAVEEHPIPGSSAYELHPVSVAPLRKELFGLIHGADQQVAAVAEACLANIDTLRDHFGTLESEPRHPDIASGKPWPRQAGEHEPSGGSE